jgi:uncharacterized membrane protein YidH (DUF202 family)
MRRTGLVMLYVVATAIALGGVGDLTVRAPFEVHQRFLGTADVHAATSSLILHLVHALGGGLVGIGIASFALVHFAVRRGERWALWTMLAAVVAAEGANAVGVYAVGSFWYVSVTYIVLTAVGLALFVAAQFGRGAVDT